jgi:hypothetical protein
LQNISIRKRILTVLKENDRSQKPYISKDTSVVKLADLFGFLNMHQMDGKFE